MNYKKTLIALMAISLLALVNAYSSAAGTPDGPAAPSATPFKILGLSHIGIKVSDIEKSRAFYESFFGYEESGQLKTTTGSLSLAFVKVNDTQYFELFTGLKPGEDRLYQVAFQVEGIEALRAHLAAAGIKVPASVPQGRAGNSNFSIKDPAGHIIELVQYEPRGWTMRDQGKFMPKGRISPRIRHAGVLTPDAGASLKFYSELFGFTETWRGSANGQVISWICLKTPGSDDYMELMLRKPPLTMDALGVNNHLSLEVPDIERAKAALEASPYRKAFNKPIEVKTGKNMRRQLNLFDPDGTRVELMEPGTVDGKPATSSPAPLP